MSWAELFQNLLEDYTLRNIALGAATLGALSGMLGSFAVLRRQSLLGDVISHAALPGIALVFILTGSKSFPLLLAGAALAGWIGTVVVHAIMRTTIIKDDGALGIILAVFFGVGLVLLTYIQKNIPDASQAGLDKFLFGQAAAIVADDVKLMYLAGGVLLLLLFFFWKEFKIITFDADYAFSLGLPMKSLEVLLFSLLVIVIVLGLQMVGVVLMSAMLVAPGAAARQWTDHLWGMVLIAWLFGVLAGVSGALISALSYRMPTGPVIVLMLAVLFVFSLIFGYNRGFFWVWLRRQKQRQHIDLDAVLMHLYEIYLQHASLDKAHTVKALRVMQQNPIGVKRTLEILESSQWVAREGKSWRLTEKGLIQVQTLLTWQEKHV